MPTEIQPVLIRGEPLANLPADLFIPPEALRVILESFTGPLDLLLYLIKKQNLDILEVDVAELTRQYLTYIDLMQSARMDLAAEYLLMAAILLEMKSRLLLPRSDQDEEAEEEDPRAALLQRLLQYEIMVKAAEQLFALPQNESDFLSLMFQLSIRLCVAILKSSSLTSSPLCKPWSCARSITAAIASAANQWICARACRP